MGVLKAKVGGLWVPVGNGSPLNGNVYGINHYYGALGGNTVISNAQTNLVTIAMPAAPAGSLLDISYTIYHNQGAGGSGSTFYNITVNGVAGPLTLVAEDRISLLSYSGRVANIAQPVGIAYNIILYGIKSTSGGTVQAQGTNTALTVVSYRP